MFRMFAVVLLVCTAPGAHAACEAYGNFETMGIVVDCPKDRKPDEIGRVKVYLLEGEKKRPLQDAVQVGSFDFFATSVFWLEPGKTYNFAVEICDKDGKVIAEEKVSGSTRPEFKVPANLQTIEVKAEEKGALRDALAKAQPGTAIVLRKGVYYDGDFKLGVQASPEKPLVIRGYPGEEAVLDGSDPEAFEKGWEKQDGGLWKHAWSGGCENVCLEEKAGGKLVRVAPMRSMDELTARKIKEKALAEMGIDAAYFCDGKAIFLFAPDADLGKYRVRLPQHTRAFDVEGGHGVVFENLTMRHYGKDAYGCAIFFRDSSDCVVQHCKMSANNTMIWLKGVCDRNLVQDNEFFDDATRWSFGFVKTQAPLESGSVYVDEKYAGRGLVIRHNRIEGLFDGAHLVPDDLHAVNPRTQETDFYRNQIVRACDDLMEIDGRARNVRVFENFMENSLSGVSVAQALDGPVWLLYNVIARQGNSTGTSIDKYEGYPIKTNGGNGTEIGTGWLFMYHNTSWLFDPNGYAFLIKKAKWKKFVFRDNIWVGHTGGFNSWNEALSPIDMDHDCFFADKGPQVKIRKTESAPGDKGNGVVLNFFYEDPKLVNATGGDYRLASGSPCVAKGVPIPGIDDARYKGAAPDLGFLGQGQELPEYGPRK
ncbi:MAG: right-handed parallel beta-helix repeat-containing protein [Planctomycetes bacterium]|nr:right-handed parallel beta-helix repeat-containing protein [Planctomycetota bacterium]